MDRPLYHLLVLTNTPQHVRLLEQLLRQVENAHFTVTYAPSMDASLTALSTHPYDLAVVDASLPAWEGVAFLEEKQQRGLQTPVFVLTALTRADPAGLVWREPAAGDGSLNGVDAALLGREIQRAIACASA